MEQFIWRDIGTVILPGAKPVAWTPALEAIAPKRIYKFAAEGTWTINGASSPCTADGDDSAGMPAQDPVCAGTPLGALIGKLGGSSADRTGMIFAIGRYCVIQFDDPKVGALYLGANHVPPLMAKIEGEIKVHIQMAL